MAPPLTRMRFRRERLHFENLAARLLTVRLGGSPCPVGPGEIANSEAMLAQDARRDIGTLAALAVRDDFTIGR